jgi:hypothetical protein
MGKKVMEFGKNSGSLFHNLTGLVLTFFFQAFPVSGWA